MVVHYDSSRSVYTCMKGTAFSSCVSRASSGFIITRSVVPDPSASA